MPDPFEFHLRLRRMRSLAAMTGLFRATIAPFGFDTFACGELDLRDVDRCVYYVIDWPERWRRFYLSSGLVQHDPVVSSLAYRREPFTWTDLRRDRRLGKVGRAGLNLAADLGWTEGYVVPMPSTGRRIGLVSLVGSCKEISPEIRAFLALACIGFQLHVRPLVAEQGFAVPPIGLTHRELHCIRLVAQGNSDKAIASALGIASSTAHEFIEKAKRRLKARTRPEMTAIAVALGIVDPLQGSTPIPSVRRSRITRGAKVKDRAKAR
jgi:LuxR family transcriptional regulator, quorum-sensing system regulator BjaR1